MHENKLRILRKMAGSVGMGLGCLLLLGYVVFAAGRAEMTPLVLASMDSEDGYRYVISGTNLGFASTSEADTTESMAILVVDSDVYWELEKDTKKISYTSGSLIFENGNYTLLISPSEKEKDQVYALFHFTIFNSFMESSGGTPTAMDAKDIKLVFLSDNQLYGYQIGETQLFYMNVPNGAVTEENVEFTPTEAVTVKKLYRNGVEQREKEQQHFKEPGSYLIELFLHKSGIAYWVSFRIVDAQGAAVSTITAPVGFELSEAFYNDEKLEIGPQQSIGLGRDGTYRFTFRMTEEEEVQWHTVIRRDTVPPGVYFSQNIDSGVVSGEITLTSTEESHKLEIYKDNLRQGTERLENGLVLSGSGNYRIQISDAANNSRQYTLILYDFWLVKIALLCILILGIGGGVWLVVNKKRRETNGWKPDIQ